MNDEQFRLYTGLIILCREYDRPFTSHDVGRDKELPVNVVCRYLATMEKIGCLVIREKRRLKCNNKAAVYAVADDAVTKLRSHYDRENKKLLPVYAGRKKKQKPAPVRAEKPKLVKAIKRPVSDLPKIGGKVVAKAHIEPKFGRSLITRIDAMLREVRCGMPTVQ